MSQTVQNALIFNNPIDQVYKTYWDLSQWPLALPDIMTAEADYDDGLNQNFSMTVRKDGQIEHVAGARFGSPYSKIELCQFQVPPGFKSMRGAWYFEAADAGSNCATKVIVKRTFELKNPAKLDVVSLMVSGLLVKNLEGFRDLLMPRAA